MKRDLPSLSLLSHIPSLLFSSLFSLLILGCITPSTPSLPSSSSSPSLLTDRDLEPFSPSDRARARELEQWIQSRTPHYEKLGPPQVGEWRYFWTEKPQSFAEYLRDRPAVAWPPRHILYLQPLGRLEGKDGKRIQQLEEFLGLFFGLPTRRLPPIPYDTLPKNCHVRLPEAQEEAIQTSVFLQEVLRPRCPPDASAVLAITDRLLLRAQGISPIFGLSMLYSRVGVISLARLDEMPSRPSPTTFAPLSRDSLFLLRLFKLASHEVAHMMSLPHCVIYRCGMNGRSRLAEVDEAPLAFCPECLAKVIWATRLDPTARRNGLLPLYQRMGWMEEAKREREESIPPG